ncbi:MAG: ATP-binding protein [Steroidobacteraceae bacterium]
MNSLAARFGIIVLVIHVVLLPVLFVQLDRIVTMSLQEMFVTEIRTYARIVADELELGNEPASEQGTRALLENILLSGEGLFAELVDGDKVLHVQVTPPGSSGSFLQEDFEFGQGGDDVYYLATPVARGDRELSLRIGFDERPVMAQIKSARQRILLSLGVYFLLALTLAMFLGHRLAGPLAALQRVSRRVAAGDIELKLTADSQIRELRDLAEDLERMRSELVDANHRLQSEMQKRVQEVEERRRLEQQLQVRRRLETVGTLAGGVAHEINNMLVPIQLYTELAIEDLDPASLIRADLQRVLENARRAKRVVSDILVFTHQPIDKVLQPVDLIGVVHEVLELYRRIAPAGVRIVEEVEQGPLPVLGDATMLNQVVTNLFSNAIQAIGDGDGKLMVSLGCATEEEVAASGQPPADYVVLRVRDTGHGMDELARQKIFEPFYTTRQAGQGTGLGLSVVHGIIESLGGAVTVESAPAAGAVFRVFLQRASQPASAEG